MGASDINSSQALAAIRRIVGAEAPRADGRLPTERQLSERLGVSRREVRRALDALEQEGLIWRRQGKGTFLGQPPDPAGVLAAEVAPATSPDEIMEARLRLEPALAGLCAQRAGAEDVARLRALIERVAAALDPDEAELWDGALHRLIARTAGNRLLFSAFGFLDEVRCDESFREVRERARSAGSKATYERQHRAIVDAIAAGDAAAAEAAMRAHLATLSESLRLAMAAAHEPGEDARVA